jgi:hypothetical protein
MVLLGHADSDWAGDPDTRRSTTGYVFQLGNNLITCRSRRQKHVTLSACEAETVAASDAAQEALYLCSVLKELGFPQKGPATIMQDSQSSIAFANNEAKHTKMKHIDIKEQFLRELITDGRVKTKYIPSDQNVADMFTKALPRARFQQLRHALNVVEHPYRAARVT